MSIVRRFELNSIDIEMNPLCSNPVISPHIHHHTRHITSFITQTCGPRSHRGQGTRNKIHDCSFNQNSLKDLLFLYIFLISRSFFYKFNSNVLLSTRISLRVVTLTQQLVQLTEASERGTSHCEGTFR